jgi:hypothetical protein
MGAQSDNKYDVFNWIKKIYESCDTLPQLITTNKLATAFKKKYQDNNLDWELKWHEDNCEFKLRDKIVSNKQLRDKIVSNKQLLKG